MTVIEARYAGHCEDCGERFELADQIKPGKSYWVHATCPDAKPQPVCTVCWLAHPDGACDR